MANTNMTLDIIPLRDKLVTRMFGTLVARFTTADNVKINASALESLGVTYDFVKYKLERRSKNILTPILKTALEAVDYAADEFVMNHNCRFYTTEERFNAGVSLEDAAELAFEEEDTDITSGIIADMIEDLSKKHSTEIRDLAKYILKLEKEKQGEDRELAEEEDNDYVDEGEDFENNTENGDQNDESSSDNPFEDDNNTEEDQSQDESFEQNDDSDDNNPFGNDYGDESTGDEDSDNESSGEDDSNPFDGGEEESSENDSQDDSSSEENPFGGDSSDESGSDDSSTDSDDNSSSNLDSDNPFESAMADISQGLYNGDVFRLVGIESGDIVKYVADTVGYEYKSILQNAFETAGMESPEFKSKQKEYINVSNTAIESLSAGIATMFGLGLAVDSTNIKFYV